MTSNFRKRARVVILATGMLAAALVATPECFAQLNSNSPTVTINATLAEILTVAATPASVNIALAAGTTSAASPSIAITTTWVLSSGRASVVLDGYFASATAALSGGSPVVNIPSSEVLGQMTTGTPTTYTAFSQTAALGTASAGLTLFSQTLTTLTRASTRTDNLTLEINLTSQPQLPAGSYTGTVTLQAQAM